MAKFNNSTVGANKTVNRSGHAAYKMSDKERLVTAVLTSMFGENKYYGSTDNDIVKLATDCAKRDGAFLAKLAAYARNVGNMRSVSHVLTAIIARECPEYTRWTVHAVVVRPDDITEIMSYYKSVYGKPWPNALKRQVAIEMQKFNEYQLAKYNGGSKELKLRDILRITHPDPATKEVEALFRKVLDDTLETPYTWETELSAKGNTKEVWEELITSGKVGYMALLRNLRNIIKSGADVVPVLHKLSNPEEVAKSRQLPFRYYSAYKTLEAEGLMTPLIRKHLDKALEASVQNIEKLPGRTLIAIDRSGSMDSLVSAKSTVTCYDIANLFGVMASKICEDATVCYFDAAYGYWRNTDYTGYEIKNFGKYASILDTVKQNYATGGGTDMSLPCKWMLNGDTSSVPFDRVIFFSDNECNCAASTVQSYVNKYREKFNANLYVHAIDIQGYGTQQFYGEKFNLIGGWSESVLDFIPLAEKGVSTLVEAIENYGDDIHAVKKNK